MKSIKKIVVVLFCISSLIGCGMGKDLEEPVFYKEELHSINAKFLANLSTFGLDIYMMDGSSADAQGNYELQILNKEDISEKQIELRCKKSSVVIAPDSTPIAMCVDNFGKKYFLANAEGQESFAIHIVDEQGQLLESRDVSALTQIWDNQSMGNIELAVTDQGAVYLLSDGEESILVFEEGKEEPFAAEIKDCTITAMCSANNGIYVTGNKNGKDYLYEISGENNICKELMRLPDSRGTAKLCMAENGSLYYSTYDEIYKCDTETQMAEVIYAWTSIGKTGNDVASFCSDGSGGIYTLLKKGGSYYTFVVLRDSTELSNQENMEIEKVEIVIDGDSANSSLKKLVGQFNTSSDKIKVVVKDYDEERLLTELVAGTGPDLISSAVNYQDCVQKELIEDLSPYLDRSQNLQREDLLQEVLNAYTIDGVLTCIPPDFTILNLYGRKSELGDRAGWTMNEFMEYIESEPGRSLMEGSTFGDSKTMIVIQSWWSQQERWIDWETKRAHFDSEDFIELLTAAKEYDASCDAGVFQSSTEERWQNGEIHFVNSVIYGLTDYMNLKDSMGGDMVPIGYPTMDGALKQKISSQFTYAINSKSERKEEAWSFIEYLILHQEELSEERGVMWGIPTLKAACEGKLQEEILNRNGSVKPVEEETRNQDRNFMVSAFDVTYFRQMLESISYASMGNSYVENILLEELSGFFLGERSAKDTAWVIQNRVQLYLDEM